MGTFIAACCLVVAAVTPATGSPLELVATSITRVAAILESGPVADTAERRREIAAVGEGLFDFEEMSRRAMGKHWRLMSTHERAEFTGLFKRLLETLYLRTIEGYAGARITYLASPRQGSVAEVRTEIRPRRGATVRVVYRLVQRNDQWAVYDVVVDGVGVVANYRSQFARMVETESLTALLDTMRLVDREMASAPDGDRR
jgi:phospholipid transport system substrate-binding protein